ncbi:hypothetical protein CFP56_010678 [Quercus suber]|uniref:Uncharacterized protein n=1 Tax=Quercus suber TaxID=58331 RepID=A0AAW0KZR9_QUESU
MITNDEVQSKLNYLHSVAIFVTIGRQKYERVFQYQDAIAIFTKEGSYEGNKGLCGHPLKAECGSANRRPPAPFEGIHSKSGPLIDWNYLCVELGFVSALGWSLGRLCFGRGGGYGITNVLMTFFSGSFLSCTLWHVWMLKKGGGVE